MAVNKHKCGLQKIWEQCERSKGGKIVQSHLEAGAIMSIEGF